MLNILVFDSSLAKISQEWNNYVIIHVWSLHSINHVLLGCVTPLACKLVFSTSLFWLGTYRSNASVMLSQIPRPLPPQWQHQKKIPKPEEKKTFNTENFLYHRAKPIRAWAVSSWWISGCHKSLWSCRTQVSELQHRERAASFDACRSIMTKYKQIERRKCTMRKRAREFAARWRPNQTFSRAVVPLAIL